MENSFYALVIVGQIMNVFFLTFSNRKSPSFREQSHPSLCLTVATDGERREVVLLHPQLGV